MTQVFISHSNSPGDQKFAQKLAANLPDKGITIQQILNESDILLLIISEDSMESDDVSNHWKQFYHAQKPIIRVLRQTTLVPGELMRDEFPKINFESEDFVMALEQLRTALERMSGVGITRQSLPQPYEELFDYLVEGMTPEQILAFQMSDKMQRYTDDLLSRQSAGGLTAYEQRELEKLRDFDLLVMALKARAVKALQSS